MARFHFHIFDGKRLFRDDRGIEIDRNKQLIDEAYAHIGDIRVSQPNHTQWGGWRLVVTDPSGNTVLHMTFDFEVVSQTAR